MKNTLLIHTTKCNVNIFFHYYIDGSGGYFSSEDFKPTALNEIKYSNGVYLEEHEKGLIWAKMLLNDVTESKKGVIKRIEKDWARGVKKSPFLLACYEYLINFGVKL